MTRTALKDRQLPDYTKGEETFHTVSHIVGGGFGIVALVACVVAAALKGDVFAVVSAAVYGGSLVALYTASSLYHGLRAGMAKRVFQVLDHCTIYFLIAGTYTPIALCAIRPVSPVWGWTLFGIVWGLLAVATVFTAIDLKRYATFSMACYIGMGWCVVLAAEPTIQAVPASGLLWLLLGGIAYTVGAVLYGLGKRRRYMHALFHVFALLGSILQFVCVFVYVI